MEYCFFSRKRPIKLQFNLGELRKIHVSLVNPYNQIIDFLKRIGEDVDNLTYTDTDGDELTVTSNRELLDAI